MRIKGPIITFVFLTALLFGPPGQAHQVRLFAASQGTLISGYAYFPGGGRIKGADVAAFAPDGTILTRAVTDEKGEFSFQATQRVNHRLVLETGEGHRAEFLVEAEQLPATLPGPGASLGRPVAVEAQPDRMAEDPSAPAEDDLGTTDLAGLIEEAVARQVIPLRRQIEALEAKIHFRDVVGGVGYIVGLAGLGLYLAARRKIRRNQTGRPKT